MNIAVFIDFDNIEIGVKSTLGEHFDIGTILEAIKERGEVVTKIAYADWTRAGEYSRVLTQHAIRLVQRNLTPGGDKNGADINLALDALEMAFTHTHINAYVIVGGDSDFLSLVEKLKQYDKKVFVVGGRAFTSVILQRNCHEFIAYENLVRKPAPAIKGGRPPAPPSSQPIAQAFPLVRRALKILADREVSPQTGLLKSTLLQLDSTFSERNYGASSFLDFAEKLAKAGLVSLKHAGRSVMVELNPSFEEGGETALPQADVRPLAGSAEGQPAAITETAPQPQFQSDSSPPQFDRQPQSSERPPQVGDAAEGVKAASDLFRAAVNARWPMYLRNVKQILRSNGFDERRYGFGGLMDLLRACGRDGIVRLERDRRGGIRVLQGPAFPRQAASAPVSGEAVDPEMAPSMPVIVDAEPTDEGDATDVVEIEPIAVIDTTAELLGRAKPRRPRARAAESTTTSRAAAAAAKSPRRTAARKPTTSRRPRRPKKTDSEE